MIPKSTKSAKRHLNDSEQYKVAENAEWQVLHSEVVPSSEAP